MQFFNIQELTDSATAKRLGIWNWPYSDEIFENLNALVDNILDPCRRELGGPIIVNSGYRSYQLNVAVGGAKGSQHMKGEACDIRCRDLKRLWNIIGTKDYDQRILYSKRGFIHVSYKRNGNNRKQTIYVDN